MFKRNRALRVHPFSLRSEPNGVFGMKHPIIGFHQDENGDWVARLACGHNQHVRHNPPWQNRPWVTKPLSREQHLGQMLECVKCNINAPRDWDDSITAPGAG
jgi:hypothetical protein